MSYPAGFKLKVVQFAEENGNRAAGREYTVDERYVRRCRSDIKKLKSTPRSKRAEQGRNFMYPVVTKRQAGCAVSTTF